MNVHSHLWVPSSNRLLPQSTSCARHFEHFSSFQHTGTNPYHRGRIANSNRLDHLRVPREKHAEQTISLTSSRHLSTSQTLDGFCSQKYPSKIEKLPHMADLAVGGGARRGRTIDRRQVQSSSPVCHSAASRVWTGINFRDVTRVDLSA